MSKEDPLKNWQLENGGSSPEQWKLQDAEQNLDKNMQLQPGEVGSQWQPVEYQRETRPRRNWVLPSIIIVALLGVLAYVGWIAFGQLSSGALNGVNVAGVDLGGLIPGAANSAQASPTADAAAVAQVSPTAEPATPTVEATQPPTPEVAATFTPAPPPTPALAELITGTVNAVEGVNARQEPAITGGIVRLLTQGEGLTVVAAQEGWLQVILPENKLAWVSADFVDQVRQEVPFEQLNALRTAVGLPLLEPPAPVETNTGAGPSEPPASVVVTTAGDTPLNARLTPEVSGTVVTSIPAGATLTAVGRSGDGQWLVVQLPDGALGWVLANLVTPAGDLTTLPAVEATALSAGAGVTTTGDVTTTSELTTTTSPAPALSLATNGIVPPAPFTNTLPLAGPALTISDTNGVNARSAPTTTAAVLVVVPNGAVLPVTSRSEAGDWLQVQLPDGQAGWMATTVVVVSADLSSDLGGGAPASQPAATAEATAVVAAPTPVATTAPTGPTATATIINQLGANLRSSPSMDLNPVVTVSSGDTFTAIGRTADNGWVQLALPDGTTAWALIGTVSLDRDIGTLPVTQ